MHFEKLTFFRPGELARESTRIPAQLFNECRLLLSRSATDCCFVPIRSLQCQAVITNEEIIFVDALNYAVHDGEGGRMIVLAWELGEHPTRDSLNEPVSIEMVQYHADTVELRSRLQTEFGKAMELMLKRQVQENAPQHRAKVVSIKR